MLKNAMCVSVLCVVISAWLIGSRTILINVTPSMPRGVWSHHAFTSSSRMVTLTPPPLALEWECAREDQLLLKHLWAKEGEVICMEEHAFYKALHPMHVRHATMFNQRGEVTHLAWQGCKAIPKAHIFVLGQHVSSCDSRFFGPVPVSSVQGSVTPLLVWEHVEVMP